MTTTLAAPPIDALAGHELYRFRMAGPLSRSVADVTTLKKAGDGSVTIPDVDVLKTGEFNGLQLVDGDLMAMVERFNLLRENVFTPPFRLDHSWSIYDVIGWFDGLETYQRVDESDGMGKTFLKASIRITGSINVGVDVVLDAIRRGAIEPRSSELGYYRTNAGQEFPLVYYGAAYVDIPAVEGLGGVKLSRRTEPNRITNLNTGRDPEMTQQATETTTTATGEPAGTETTTAPATGETTATTTAGGTETAAVVDSAAVVPADDESEKLRKQVSALRQKDADRQIAHFRTAGAIVPANETAATALLSHDDDGVRDLAATLLTHSSGVVKLNKRSGEVITTPDGSNGGGAEELFALDRPLSEVSAQWAELSTEERAARKPEYDKFMADRKAAGLSAGRGE